MTPFRCEREPVAVRHSASCRQLFSSRYGFRLTVERKGGLRRHVLARLRTVARNPLLEAQLTHAPCCSRPSRAAGQPTEWLHPGARRTRLVAESHHEAPPSSSDALWSAPPAYGRRGISPAGAAPARRPFPVASARRPWPTALSRRATRALGGKPWARSRPVNHPVRRVGPVLAPTFMAAPSSSTITSLRPTPT